MKKIAFAVALLLGTSSMVMTSCKSYDDESNTTENNDNTVNTIFSFNSSDVTIVSSRSAEDSGEYEQGTEAECKVNSVRLYLFDSEKKTLTATMSLKNLKRTTEVDNTSSVVYTSDKVAAPLGTFDIFAVANNNDFIAAETEAEFLNSINDVKYKEGNITDITGGIMMTNRGNSNLNVEIKKFEDPTKMNTVTINLERSIARIDVSCAKEAYPMKDGNGKEFATVKLNDYYIVNLPTSFYNFRHTAVLTELTPTEWALDKNFGKIADVDGYVIDPYFFKKQVSAADFKNQDNYYVNFYCDFAKNQMKWNALTPGKYITSYSLENCMIQPAQKNGYSTGVMFRGEIIPSADNTFILGEDGKFKTVDPFNYDVIYLFNYKFYASLAALAKAGVKVKEGMTPQDLAFLDVNVFEKENGKFGTYYKYWIRHLDNHQDLVMGVMEFGIVRNNLYRVSVKDILAPGPGKPSVDPDPDDPDEGEIRLKVEINVMPWVVRSQENIVL